MRQLQQSSAVLKGNWIRRNLRAKIGDRLSLSTSSTNAIVTLLAAAAAYVSITSTPGTIGFLAAGLAIVMLAIAVIDWRTFTIPDWLNITGAGLGIAYAAVRQPDAMLEVTAMAVLRGTVLALMFFSLRYGYAKWRGRQGLGLGDVKLAFVAGVWLDWLTIPLAIQLAAFAALSAYLLRQLVSGQSMSATNRMPFGLFLAPAIWICWLLEVRWLDGF
jgi:leader peptidase (prepilin peptidase) / N-methyltransferase